METDRRRCGKWIYMIKRMQQKLKNDEKALKRRVRKGIPDSVRGSAWPSLAQSDQFIPNSHGVNALGKQAWMKSLLNQKLTKKCLQDIFKDITRTLPQHVYFQ